MTRGNQEKDVKVIIINLMLMYRDCHFFSFCRCVLPPYADIIAFININENTTPWIDKVKFNTI